MMKTRTKQYFTFLAVILILAIIAFSAWDDTKPADNRLWNLAAGDIRTNNLAIETALGFEHNFSGITASVQTGEHDPGSAKAYWQATAPTKKPDGSTNLDANDNGRIWFDSDNGLFYGYKNGTGGTSGWRFLTLSVEIEWFGAVGDNSTDDTAAIQAAIDAVGTAGGGRVLLGEKAYKITSPLEMNANHISLIGTGTGTVIHQTTVNTDAIDVAVACATGPAARSHIRIENLSIAVKPGTGYGIHAKQVTEFSFSNLYIRAGNNTLGGGNIHIDSCYYGSINNFANTVNTTMPYNVGSSYTNWLPQYGLLFSNTQSATQMIFCSNFHIDGCASAIRFEGVATRFSQFTAGYLASSTYGIYDNATGGCDNLFFAAITTENITTKAWQLASTKTSTFIDCAGDVNTVDTSNALLTFIAHQATSNPGYANGGICNIFINCRQSGATIPTDVGTGTTWINLINDSAWPFTVILKNKQIEAIQTFTNADTTPSVGKAYKIYKTANTGATVITMFDDGYIGQIFYLIFNDINTTIDFTGTNLKGNIGVDFTGTVGDLLTCIFDGTNWYCDVSNNTV